MARTPNHGYIVPDEGTTNWHEPLNENFEELEAETTELRNRLAALEGRIATGSTISTEAEADD